MDGLHAVLTWAVLIVATPFMLLSPAGCIVPEDATEAPAPAAPAELAAPAEPQATIPIPGTDHVVLVSPEILDQYARGAETAGDALPPPIGTVATIGGWGLAALAETWRRYDRRKRKAAAEDADTIARRLHAGLLSVTEGIETSLARLDETRPAEAQAIRATLERVQNRRGVQDIVNAIRAGDTADAAVLGEEPSTA